MFFALGSLLYTLMADQPWTEALLWLTSIDSRLSDGWPALTPGTPCQDRCFSCISEELIAGHFLVKLPEILKVGFWLDWNNHQINNSKRVTQRLQFPRVSIIVTDECTVLNYHWKKKEPNILNRFPKYSAQNVILEKKLESLHVIHLIQFISLIVPFVCCNFEHAKQFYLW